MLTGTGGIQTAEEIYQALTPSLDQLGHDALIYIPTSPYCLVPETRVLTDDLRWVPVKNLKVGDGVIGFDEHQVQGNGRCWRKSEVTETSIIQAPTYQVKTTGPSVTSTGEHLWLAKRTYESGYRWVKTKDLKPGYQIGDIGTWDTDESRGAGYLAGFFDGEGHVPSSPKQGLYAGACQNPGAVLDRTLQLLDEREYDYWTHSKRKTDKAVNLGIQGGIAENMRFMGSIRPERLLPKFVDLLDGKRVYGRKSRTVEVLSIEEVEVQDVIALGTSTNTLMTEGLFSHNTKIGSAFEIYQDGLATDEDGKPVNPDLLVVQLPSWDPYKDWNNPKVVAVGTYRTAPQVLDEQAHRLEERDPEAFKVERRAQWAEVINAYLNEKMVDRIFQPIKMEGGDIRVLENHTPGVMRWVYRGHADPSMSQANFAVAVGHCESFTSVDEETGEEMTVAHVVFDWLHVWRPQDFPDHQIDYIEVEKELVGIISQFRSLKTFSYDQYGGFVTVPFLKAHLRRSGHHARVHQADFTQKSNQIRAERFKSALGMGWVHVPKDSLAPDGQSLLEQELKFLQVKNGKVDKQSVGPIQTKDLADCLDASHEVWTLRGWVPISEVTTDDLVATRAPGGLLEYHHPMGVVSRMVRPGEGLYVMDTNDLSFAATPGHRMMVEHTSLARPGMWYERIEDVRTRRAVPKTAIVKRDPHGSFVLQPVPAKRRDHPAILPGASPLDFATFVGFWLAEGKKIVPGKQGYEVRLTQTKSNGIAWFDRLLSRLGWEATRTESSKEVCWRIKSRELQEYLFALQDGHELHLPSGALESWDEPMLSGLLEGLLVDDGTWSQQAGRYVKLDSTSKILLDEVQALLCHVGMSGTVKKVREAGCRTNLGVARHDGWALYLRIRPRSILDPAMVEKVDYEGPVYCLTLPNSNFYVRRNGVPMWIGNCVMEVTSELLADQIDRLERNRNLSSTRLAVGAPGGYHTGGAPDDLPQPGGNKDKLRRIGQDKIRKRSYGQGW